MNLTNMGCPDRPTWFVIRATPRREMTAADELQEMGFKAFVPVEILKLRSGRGSNRMIFKEVMRPFFPSYLFAQVQMDIAAWHTIKSNRHISAIVSSGAEGRPTPVPDAAMSHLIAAGPYRDPGPQVGESIKLLTGPFAGTFSKIMAVDKLDRIKVLIRFMGTDRPVELHLSEVERLPDGLAAHRAA